MESTLYPNIFKNRLYLNYQLNAHFLYSVTIYTYMYITLQSSPCFEQYLAHLQEDKLYYYSLWYRLSL